MNRLDALRAAIARASTNHKGHAVAFQDADGDYHVQDHRPGMVQGELLSCSDDGWVVSLGGRRIERVARRR